MERFLLVPATQATFLTGRVAVREDTIVKQPFNIPIKELEQFRIKCDDIAKSRNQKLRLS